MATTPRAKAASTQVATVDAVTTTDHADTVSKAQTAALKSYEDIVGFGKEAVEAFVEAGNIFTRGFQDIGTKVMGIAQGVVEDNVTASKQLFAAKTIRDVVDLQTSFSRAQFDRLVSEGSHISDLSVKLVEESFAPLGEKVNAVIDKLVKAA
jgi:phasin family protein